MAKRVTITDVARETGVSIKTVSNVLNNTGSMRPETRQRVQDAIERLGYRVNVSARAMKTGGTKLIGLAITDFCQPFMPYLADSIVAAARSRGYAVITDTYNSAGGLAQAIPETKKLAAGRAGSSSWASPIVDRTILHQPYPLVIVGDYDTQGLADWVTMPNVEAVRTAVGSAAGFGMPQDRVDRRHRGERVPGRRPRSRCPKPPARCVPADMCWPMRSEACRSIGGWYVMPRGCSPAAGTPWLDCWMIRMCRVRMRSCA